VILSGNKILECVQRGLIEVDPFDPKQINPVSYDLTLGDKYAVYLRTDVRALDSRQHNDFDLYDVPSKGVTLMPGRGYLMHTRERVRTDHFVPVLDGKSSIGRLFVQVHVTAGYGDPGFDGQYTLEVTCVHPVVLYAGMRIAQMRFHTIEGEVMRYDGNYKGETSRGPVPSMSWRQFK
jgi:dCTP deaminase